MLCRMKRNSLPAIEAVTLQLSLLLLLLCATASAFSQARAPASGDESTIKHIDKQFHQAFLDADTKKLQELLASNFIWMHGDGELWSKDRLVEEFRSGKLRYRRDETDRTKVILYDGAAIVVGHNLRQYDKGEPFEFEYTTTYVKQAGQWRVGVFHSSYCACAKP